MISGSQFHHQNALLESQTNRVQPADPGSNSREWGQGLNLFCGLTLNRLQRRRPQILRTADAQEQTTVGKKLGPEPWGNKAGVAAAIRSQS